MNKFHFVASIYSKFVLLDCFKNPVRTWITIFGIALGVSVFLAINLANRTALSSFGDTVNKVAGEANLEIRPVAGDSFDQNILKDIQWLWMVDTEFSPIISADAVLEGDTNEVVRVLAVDIFSESKVKNYELDESKNNKKLFSKHGVLVGETIAKERSFERGDSFSLLVGENRFSVVVDGFLSPDKMGSAYGGRIILMDISLAQELLGMEGLISQIEIVAPRQYLPEIQTKLQKELPPSVKAEPAKTRTEKIERMSKSFEYNLFALSFIALLVGMFLIYNTMAITVIRRRPEIGTLRTLGVSSKNILILMLSEALTLGLVGSLLGVVFGTLMANWALQAVAKTYQRLYFSLPLESVALEPEILVIAFSIGVILTLIAATPACIEGSYVAPATATRSMTVELAIERWSVPFMYISFLLFGLSGFCSTLPAVDNFPLFGYASAFFSVIGLAFLMPILLKKLLPIFSKLLSPFIGLEFKLAMSSLVRTLGRTSVAVATLSVGLAMLVSLAIMIGSFRQTVIDWANQTLVADLWMRPAAADDGKSDARFKAGVYSKLLAIKGIKTVAPWTQSPIEYKGLEASLGGARFDIVEANSNLIFLSGRKNDEVSRRIRGQKCIVSESFSIKHKVNAGDKITIPTKIGPLELLIEDVYYDYVNDSGFIVINRPVYEKHMLDRSFQSFAIHVKPGEDANKVRQQIYKSLGKDSLFVVRTTGELRERILSIFDDTFAITYALHSISVLVAILSVMNALFALTEESKKEFGILRYIGASKNEIRKLVFTEAGLLGLSGCVFGILLGLVLAFILIFVINKQSFGWTVRLMIPFDFIWQTVLIIMATSFASAAIPATRASKTLAPEVVRSE